MTPTPREGSTYEKGALGPFYVKTLRTGLPWTWVRTHVRIRCILRRRRASHKGRPFSLPEATGHTTPRQEAHPT